MLLSIGSSPFLKPNRAIVGLMITTLLIFQRAGVPVEFVHLGTAAAKSSRGEDTRGLGSKSSKSSPLDATSSTDFAKDSRYLRRVLTTDEEGNGIITTRDLSKGGKGSKSSKSSKSLKSGKSMKSSKSSKSLKSGKSMKSSKSWNKLGDNIIAEKAKDYFGRSICLSKNGSVLAVGGPYNDGNGDYSGHVRVYKLSGGEWIQRGADFDGDAAYDELGTSVALSDDGSVVIMGAPGNDDIDTDSGHVRVYEWSKDGSSEAWTQKGSTIKGEAGGEFRGEESGYSVTMNRYGSIIGVGAPGNDGKNGAASGQVRVFEFNDGSSSWVQRGQGIDGERKGDFSGSSISLDYSGNTIAIGAPGNGSADSGHVRVYDWDESTWVQRGEDIDGESKYDRSGWSVSLNDAGTVVAIGSPAPSGNILPGIGMARVFEWKDEEGRWIQRGASIIAEEKDDELGYSISLDSSGDTMVIGAPKAGDGGIVYVYEWEDDHDDGRLTSTWNLKGEMVQGESGDYEEFGRSVSISAHASTFAAGAPLYDGGTGYAGVARVYKWS